jgi:hypothetical protein
VTTPTDHHIEVDQTYAAAVKGTSLLLQGAHDGVSLYFDPAHPVDNAATLATFIANAELLRDVFLAAGGVRVPQQRSAS